MQVVYKDMTRDRAKSNVAKWNFVTEWNGMTFYFTYRQTTCIPSSTMKTTPKVPSEHTQSLHYMNNRQFFTCLNCIPPIKFHFAKLDFAPPRVISL